MSVLATLARPYAKAAFQLARAGSTLAAWDEMLSLAAGIVSEPSVAQLLVSPHLSAEQAVELIAEAGGESFDDRFRGYLSVLAENGRLSLMPEVASMYTKLRHQAERRLVAKVVSAVALDDDQKARIQRALSRRFDADIELENEIDENVIGGAVIYAGDQVIDGSLRGRLRKLEQSLAS